MRFDKHILSVVFLFAALAYTLWFVFAGFGNHQDPLYWLYKYQHLEGGWMAVGTLLTGGAIVRLFGAQLLPLRLAGWLCTVTAISLPYGCLLTKEQRRDNLHWLALTWLLMGYGAFQEFSPGTLSVLLLSALWVTAVRSHMTNGQWQTLPAVIMGLAVSVRFPNILALLVLIPLWKKKCLWNIPVVALTAGAVYLVATFLVTPAPLDAAMTSHEMLSMLTKLWDNGGRLIGYMLLAVGVLAIGGKFLKTTGKLQIGIALVVGALLVYFLAMTTKPFQWYNTDLTYLIAAFCLVIALTNKSQITNHKCQIGAAMLIVATLGTDTAWLKLFPAVLCLLPVAAPRYDAVQKRYLFIVLAMLSVFVINRMTANSVGQSNLTKVQTLSTISPYRHIAIREAEQQRLAQYKADYDTLQLQMTNHRLPILSVGQENHLMRAVTGCEAARYNEFWSNIFDSVYTARYRVIVEQERPIVFCSFSPQFKTKPDYIDKESRMEHMLLELGYRTVDRSKYRYMIYIPEDELEIR